MSGAGLHKGINTHCFHLFSLAFLVAWNIVFLYYFVLVLVLFNVSHYIKKNLMSYPGGICYVLFTNKWCMFVSYYGMNNEFHLIRLSLLRNKLAPLVLAQTSKKVFNVFLIVA